MKTIKVSDEDYAAIAKILARDHSDLFTRIFMLKAKRQRKEVKDTGMSDTDMEYFHLAWKAWPDTVKGKWIPGQGFEVKPVLKGSRKMAAENFSAMLVNGTARELYAAAIVYLNEAPSVKEGYIQNVATFYGPRKATVLEYLERAKALIEVQDAG